MKHIQIKGKHSTYFIFPQLSKFIVDEDHFHGKTFTGFRFPDGKRFFIRHIKLNNIQYPLLPVMMHQESLIQGKDGYYAGSVEIIQENDHLFLVREFVEGISLKSLLRTHTFNTKKKQLYILKLFRRILESLDAIHSQDIIHCNLRPSCIIIRTRAGKIDFKSPEIIIVDFSLARTGHFDPPTNSKLPQTYLYNAPEVLLNKHQIISPSSDLYSIGIMLYEALKGHHPFRIKHPKVVGDMHLTTPISNFRGIHPLTEQTIKKATERVFFEKPVHLYTKDQINQMLKHGISDRHSSATECIQDLDQSIAEFSGYLSKSKYGLPADKTNPVVVFDDLCVLCTSALHFMIRKDRRNTLRYAGINSDVMKNLQLPNDRKMSTQSVILIEEGKFYTKSDAFIRIMKHLGGWYHFFQVFLVVPKFIRNAVYDLIAKNRYSWWGKRTECYIPQLYEKYLFTEFNTNPEDNSEKH